jgi:8-oxo-dGTP pyrophosphatase MutT (NUDIX family)
MLVRPTARVLALDPAGRVLLVRCDHDGRVFWVAPGGGVEPGETFEAAARRELREEAGIALAAVGPCVLAGDAVGRLPHPPLVVAGGPRPRRRAGARGAGDARPPGAGRLGDGPVLRVMGGCPPVAKRA